jgi:hypothetical protein
MNIQGFPRDFLLKFKPELEEVEPAAIAPSMDIRPPISTEAGFLTVSPQSTDKPGVVEIVIRIKLGARDTAQAGSATASVESFCEFDGKNRSADHR